MLCASGSVVDTARRPGSLEPAANMAACERADRADTAEAGRARTRRTHTKSKPKISQRTILGRHKRAVRPSGGLGQRELGQARGIGQYHKAASAWTDGCSRNECRVQQQTIKRPRGRAETAEQRSLGALRSHQPCTGTGKGARPEGFMNRGCSFRATAGTESRTNRPQARSRRGARRAVASGRRSGTLFSVHVVGYVFTVPGPHWRSARVGGGP